MRTCRWHCGRQTKNVSGICDLCWKAAELLRSNTDEGYRAWVERKKAKQAKETTVTDWHLAQAYYYHQERDRSEQILEKLRASNSAEEHVRAHASLASFLAARGERKRADQLLKEIAGSAYMDHHAAYSIGAAYAQLGRPEEAVKWLTRAVETGLPCYPWFEKDPLLDSLRASPDFQRLMGNLKKYWESVNTRYASLATSAA